MVCNSLVVVTILYKVLSWSRFVKAICCWGRRRRTQTQTGTAGSEDSAGSNNTKSSADELDYNTGERAIGLGGASIQHSTLTNLSSCLMESVAESQLTDIHGVQMCSYSLGAILEGRSVDSDPSVASSIRDNAVLNPRDGDK